MSSNLNIDIQKFADDFVSSIGTWLHTDKALAIYKSLDPYLRDLHSQEVEALLENVNEITPKNTNSEALSGLITQAGFDSIFIVYHFKTHVLKISEKEIHSPYFDPDNKVMNYRLLYEDLFSENFWSIKKILNDLKETGQYKENNLLPLYIPELLSSLTTGYINQIGIEKGNNSVGKKVFTSIIIGYETGILGFGGFL